MSGWSFFSSVGLGGRSRGRLVGRGASEFGVYGIGFRRSLFGESVGLVGVRYFGRWVEFRSVGSGRGGRGVGGGRVRWWSCGVSG